jgi:hypothetical protein
MGDVRLGFPLMLIISLAIHGGVALGIALTCFHSAAASIAASPEVKPTSLILLRSKETPDSQPLSDPVAANPILVSAPVPSPAQPVTEKKAIVAVAPPVSLALEVNPNAHIPALPPEAILSPNTAPQLNGKDRVVFVLDISGSMYEPYAGSTRLAFARQELSRRIRALADGTPFAITVYAERARNSGPLVAASDATRDAAVRFIMEDMDCGGGTNLPAALDSAQQLAAGTIVLVSDGDLNISQIDLKMKARDILGPEGQGPALTIVGISPRPNTEAKKLLEALADQQGGTYYKAQLEGESGLLTSNKTEVATP